MANAHEGLLQNIEHQVTAPHKPDVLAPDVEMLLLTWFTFFLLLAVLYKFAWKPILAALDERENNIRQSIEGADKARAEMEALVAEQEQVILKAHEKSKLIVEESRHAASEAAKHIQEKARQEAQIMLENAKREIREEADRVQADLREESATIAVELAGKIIRENLDKAKQTKIIEDYIKEL